MKKIALLWAVCLFSVAAMAQDYDNFNAFMEKYSNTWASNRSFMGDNSEQIGSPCPDYDFGGGMSSKKLKGKFVLMNFWATWCGGCRLLACDLDTLAMRSDYAKEFSDVVILGVNAHEKLADKGYKAKQWWTKEKQILYPSVYGKACDRFCDEVKAGHPCMMLIDDEGIIRGRWDAWTPTAARDALFAVWALHVVPRDGIKADVATAERYLANGRTMEAAYLLSLMPEDNATAFLRYKTLKSLDTDQALSWLDGWRSDNEASMTKDNTGKWTNATLSFFDALEDITDYILVNPDATLSELRSAESAMSLFQNYFLGREKNIKNIIKTAKLRYRYGKQLQITAEETIRRIIDNPNNYGFDDIETKQLEKEMNDYFMNH